MKAPQGCRNRGCTLALPPPNIFFRAVETGVKPPHQIFLATSSCTISIFSINLGSNWMGAHPIFHSFLLPWYSKMTYGQFLRIIRESSRILKVIALILASKFEGFWGHPHPHSWSQSLLSFSKTLEIREWEWESSRFEVSFTALMQTSIEFHLPHYEIPQLSSHN